MSDSFYRYTGGGFPGAGSDGVPPPPTMSDSFYRYTSGGFPGAGSDGVPPPTTMSDSFYRYAGGGFPGEGGDGAPPPPQQQQRYSDYEIDLIAARYADVQLPDTSADVGYFDAHVGGRRSAEVLYRQSFMGSHSTAGQSEALYSSNTMVKRPRLESSFPIYPQRRGTKECAFYMRNKTCKYGEACKFDHPLWVPEGGVPNWREFQNTEDAYPERPGEPDCLYFTKTSTCKFRSQCKFNHPKEKVYAFKACTDNKQSLIADSVVLPVRPSMPVCSFYAKTGKCKFGAKCKFNHPKDIEVPPMAGKQTIYTAKIDEAVYSGAADASVPTKTHAPAAPAEANNAKGLPIRPGEVDCSYYMKTGSCMYGSTCRYNHPDRPVVDVALTAPVVQSILPTPALIATAPVVQSVLPTPALTAPVVQSILPTPALTAPVVHSFLPTPAPAAPVAVLNPAATLLHGFDIHATHVPVEHQPIIYPQRPGEAVCDFYMKTGNCKYSENCKFHHPIDRSRPDEILDPRQTVTLTLAGLPRREDAEVCAFYMKSGTCMFGAQCKFDHPSPEEAAAKLQAAVAGKKIGKKATKRLAAAVKKAAAKKADGLGVVLAER